MSREMPSENGLDNTLNLLKDGYCYIMNRKDRFDSDVFETRILGQKAICLVGEEAAEIFYDESKFKRKGAAPNRVKETLFGKGGVQGLDDNPHKHRKEMFMELMSDENLKRFTAILNDEWQQALTEWEQKEEIVFYKEVQKILTKAACRWAGIPVEEDIKNLSDDIASLFESPATIGPSHWIGRMNRNKLEKWVKNLVENVREGTLEPPSHSALYQFSCHIDENGNELEPDIAAVEVINIIRPIVANAIYLNFLVIALNDFPEESGQLRKGGRQYAEMFIQEVRRHYPFFPFLTAVVREDFTWKGYKFEEGTMTLLDLYGSNHHPDMWEAPEVFNPERFRNWNGGAFSLIPQGGGDHYKGHRCPGEAITLATMHTGIDFLLNRMDYELPEQDLTLSMNDIPSVPDSEIIMKNIRSMH